MTLSTGSLSRKHAMILVEQGSHFVMDLGSRNKTFRKMVCIIDIAHIQLNGDSLGSYEKSSVSYSLTIDPPPNHSM